LHRLIYVIAILGVWHFWWQVKKDIREPCCTPAASPFCSAIAYGGSANRGASRSRVSASHRLQGPMQLEQQALRGLPIDARIGDGQSVFHLLKSFGWTDSRLSNDSRA